jgi:hypothetical protein
MIDMRIQQFELMIGFGHPIYPDSINRLSLVSHNIDGSHQLISNTWMQGTGAPTSSTGVDGIYYVNTSNSYVYYRQSGIWSYMGSLISQSFTAIIGDATSSGTGSVQTTVLKIRNTPIPAPTSANDGMFIQYNNITGSFQYNNNLQPLNIKSNIYVSSTLGTSNLNTTIECGTICTISIATPAVVTLPYHGFYVGSQVAFSTTGILPTGINAGTTYYVISSGLRTNQFEISATLNGSAINTTGSQSGTHYISQSPLTLTLPSSITIPIGSWFEIYNPLSNNVLISGIIDDIQNPILYQYNKIYVFSDGNDWRGYFDRSPVVSSQQINTFTTDADCRKLISDSIITLTIAGNQYNIPAFLNSGSNPNGCGCPCQCQCPCTCTCTCPAPCGCEGGEGEGGGGSGGG